MDVERLVAHFANNYLTIVVGFKAFFTGLTVSTLPVEPFTELRSERRLMTDSMQTLFTPRALYIIICFSHIRNLLSADNALVLLTNIHVVY